MTSFPTNAASKEKAYKDMEIVDGWQCVAMNEKFSINANLQSAEFYIENLQTGEKYYSSPQDAENNLTGEMLNQAKSLVRVEYLSASGERLSMDNYDFSVLQGKYSVKKLEDGIRFEFTLSKGEVTIDMLPKMIERSKFENKILSKLDADSKKVVQKRYSLYTKGAMVGGLTWEQISKKYPEVKNKDYYILSESTPKFDYEKLYVAIFEKSDYTLKDFEDDKSADEDIVQKAEFFVPVEITLSEYGISANVPCDEIKFTPSFPPIEIYLLEYFGAASAGSEGYILLPDGSGALLDFTTANGLSSSIRCNIYGSDGALSENVEPTPIEQSTIPFFGMNDVDSAFVSIVTDGDAHCFINGKTAGGVVPYQLVNAAFTITPYDMMVVHGSKSDIITYKFQEKPYNGDIEVQYMLLSDDAGYSQMAATVREYLIANKIIPEMGNAQKSILNVDLLATAKYKKYFLGIPYNALYTLTDCDEAIEIVKQLNKKGADSVSVGYKGWRNGGLNPSIATLLSVNRKIGGKKGLAGLSEYLSENNELYLDLPVQSVYKSGLFFNKWSSAVRYTYQKIAEQYPYNIARMSVDKSKQSWQWLSPTRIPKVLNKFINKMERLELEDNTSLLLNDLGDSLNSNFHKSDRVDRQESLKIIKNTLADISKDKNIVVEKGNLYTLAYADKVIDLPLKSSGYHSASKSVPFTAMVLHGSVAYTGNYINLADDPTEELLRAVECGAGFSYCWTYASDKELLKLESEELEDYHSLNYKAWINEAAENYKKVSSELSNVADKAIDSHCYLTDDVVCTTYADGTNVYVNYGYEDYQSLDVTVSARDYLVIKGDKK